MVNKKKQSCNISLYLSLFVVFLACFLYLFVGCSSYAMTIDELSYYIDSFDSNIQSSNFGYSSWKQFYNNYKTNYLNNIETTFINNNLDFSDVTLVRISQSSYSPQFYYILGDDYYLKYDSVSNPKNINSYYTSTGRSKGGYYNTGDSVSSLYDFALYIVSSSSNYAYGIYPTQNIYTDYPPTTTISLSQISNEINKVIYTAENPTPQNSISLVSSSNHKFGFNDKNQCLAYLTGYDIEDITFYVDRYINNEWQQFTDASEYYRLSDYDEPYYIFWSNINYFPVGTYRYRAVYDNDNQYTSSNFTITNMIIDNEGSYNNGNISIDTGNTVDNIKDYFGGQVDTSIGNINDDDIENSLGLERTVNPYQNFVLTIVNGLLDSLLGTSPEYISFKVHSWGQTFKIYVDDVVPNYGTDLRNFLTLISTVVVMIYIIRWITKVVESINTANVDTTLDLIEEKYSDLL